jgi:undecaprenyl-diphosphatase
LVLVPVLGEALLDLLEGGFSVGASGIPVASLVAGFAAAFVSGVIACRWMLALVKRGRLIWFALYCAAVGILSIVLG